MHTGNTSSQIDSVIVLPVYPCAYREHTILIGDNVSVTGLSLCIQGTQHLKHQKNLAERFIPVHTGNTKNGVYELKTQTVYPCVYREHVNKIPRIN